MSEQMKTPAKPGFKVIQGGAENFGQSALVGPSRNVGAATAHALAEEERLRQMILKTRLPNKSKADVESALRELSEADEASEDEAVQSRVADLIAGLSKLGVKYVRQSERGFSEGARWVLHNPEHFLEHKPASAALYPLAHDMMVVQMD